MAEGINEIFIQPRHAGRTRATEIFLISEAATEEDARLCIRDLHEKGYAMMRGGKRYVPPAPSPPVIFFDEGPAASRPQGGQQCQS